MGTAIEKISGMSELQAVARGNGKLTTPPLLDSLKSLVTGQKYGPARHVLRRELTQAEMGGLRDVLSACREMEVPGPTDRTARAVARLLIAFPSANMSESVGRVRAEVYRDALSDLPAWAVELACRDWSRGDAGVAGANYAFAPTSAQLHIAASGHVFVLRHMANDAEMMLRSQPWTYEELRPTLEDWHRRGYWPWNAFGPAPDENGTQVPWEFVERYRAERDQQLEAAE